MTPAKALEVARAAWPSARLRRAKLTYTCDGCPTVILSGSLYVDPGDSNPDRAGGFGGYRYCLCCAGGKDLIAAIETGELGSTGGSP